MYLYLYYMFKYFLKNRIVYSSRTDYSKNKIKELMEVNLCGELDE